ncbi:hypothetical protein SELMODRAFT_421870 [Selaginella moellendorffii]|uniref:Bulb-type lectin domain-containing protein n=1 Tax=Selaginella moellendorffii TaxID=88036 RepID=D8SGL8_SELML|nr:hypothetical protein SELMODRAFT_421870 [Selaginella moellendorffii]
MAIRITMLVLLVMLDFSSTTAESELVVGKFYGFGMSSRDSQLDANANAGMAPEILTSPGGSYSLIFWAFFGSGAQLRIVMQSGFVKWSSPCETIQRNRSASTYSDSYSSGYNYGFNFNFTDQGELQVLVSGFVRWSTNTSGRGVVRAALQGTPANLVLLDATNASIWQSRDHKTAALCPVIPEPLQSSAAANAGFPAIITPRHNKNLRFPGQQFVDGPCHATDLLKIIHHWSKSFLNTIMPFTF